MFKAIAKQDFVLYHPYDSFEVIIDLLKEAAKDPNVFGNLHNNVQNGS